MRKNIKLKVAVFGLILATLIPTQSFGAPVSSPGKTSGNGPCVTSGSTNSQTQSIKYKACQTGDIGPGGGLVYYVDSSVIGFPCGASSVGSTITPKAVTTCHYLEVAPNGWNNGGADPLVNWFGPTYRGEVPGIAEDVTAYNNALGIGLGLQNSLYIVDQIGPYNLISNNYAAGAARAYSPTVASVTYNDWYLPTTAELNLLFQWTHKIPQDVTAVILGLSLPTGYVNYNYYSSSEGETNFVWTQKFGSGIQSPANKVNTLGVRPVRAF